MPHEVLSENEMGKIHEQYLGVAEEAAQQGTCVRRKVGAAIVSHGRVVCKGFNGPDTRLGDCLSAGCPRCVAGGNTGEGYDQCICVHAEERAIAIAAKTGIALNGASLYVNLRPCLSCLILAIEAGITSVVYTQHWYYSDERLESAYKKQADLLNAFIYRGLI
jgi:dCMP deaminase